MVANYKVEQLDEQAVALYRYVLQQGVLGPDDPAPDLGLDGKELRRARDVLVAWKLLIPADGDGSLVASDPEIAEFELGGQVERQILAHRQRLVSVHHQMRGLGPVFAAARRQQRVGPSVRTLHEPRAVRREIGEAVRQCQREVLTMQPGGGRRSDTLKEVLERDLGLVRRGVEMRILYQRTARSSRSTRSYVQRMVKAGAQIRVTGDSFERTILVDREMAFIPQERVTGEAPGAAVVTDPTVVAFLHRVFENTWRASEPFDAADTSEPSELDGSHASILRLMAAGLKDDVIARHLGMATRTCRRYISEIMEELGASSRFEAGVKAAQGGLIKSGSQGPVRSS